LLYAMCDKPTRFYFLDKHYTLTHSGGW